MQSGGSGKQTITEYPGLVELPLYTEQRVLCLTQSFSEVAACHCVARWFESTTFLCCSSQKSCLTRYAQHCKLTPLVFCSIISMCHRASSYEAVLFLLLQRFEDPTLEHGLVSLRCRRLETSSLPLWWTVISQRHAALSSEVHLRYVPHAMCSN